MKKLRMIICLVIFGCMMIAATSCSKATPTESADFSTESEGSEPISTVDSGMPSSGEESASSQDVSVDSKTSSIPTVTNAVPKKLDNPNISIFIPYELTYVIKEAIKRFESTYNGKVKILSSPWDVKEIKLTTYITTNEAPDVVSLWFQDMPKYAVKNILQPIDNLDKNNTLYDYKVMGEIFSYNNSFYAVTGQTDPVLLYFNNTMIKNAGLISPLEYYNDGLWDWNTFRTLAYDLTEDTNGDLINDIVGFGTWIDGVFLTANGTDLLKYEAGKPKLNLDDPKFTQAMQFYFDMFNIDKSIQTEHWSWYEGFKQKKVAMFVERSYIADNLVKDGFSDEWDIAPFPKGPGATKQLNHIMPDGWGIGKGAKNTEASKAFINILLKTSEEFKKNPPAGQGGVLTASQKSLLEELSKSTVAPKFEGYGNMFSKFIAFTDDLRQNNPVGTSVGKFEPIFQKEIDMTLAGKR